MESHLFAHSGIAKKNIFLVFSKNVMTLTTQKSDEAFYVNIFSATKNSLALIYIF